LLNKIKRLFTDNRLKDLLSGNMVIGDEIINGFVKEKGLPPDIDWFEVECGDGEIGIDVRGVSLGIRFKVKGSVRLLGVRINSDEQVIRLMPARALEISTDNAEIRISLKPGKGLLLELESLMAKAPEDLARAVEIEDDAIKLKLHELPEWSEEFERRLKQIPVVNDLQINLLEYIEISDVRIEPGAIRIMARRR